MNLKDMRERFNAIELRTLAKWGEDDDGYDYEVFVEEVVTDEVDELDEYVDEHYADRRELPDRYLYSVCFRHKGDGVVPYEWVFDVESPALARICARALAKELGGATPWPVHDYMVWPEWHDKPPYQEGPDSLFRKEPA